MNEAIKNLDSRMFEIQEDIMNRGRSVGEYRRSLKTNEAALKVLYAELNQLATAIAVLRKVRR